MLASLRRQRRVLLTTDTVGGIWTYTLDLSRLLTAEGIAVDVLVLGPPPTAAQQQHAASLQGLHLTTVDLPLDWTARDADELREASRTFFAICRGMQPDLIHLNSPGLATKAPRGAPLVIGLHSCVASWWRAVYPHEELPPDLSWRTAEVRRGLTHADAVVAPSASFANVARSIYGVERPIEVVHNGREAPAMPAATSRDVVFTAGRLWDEAKDVATLDRAAASLPFPVHAAGPVRGPQAEPPEVRCDNLRLLGDLPSGEVRRWLARTDIFVSTACYEPFGLGVLEAAQAGCALVLCDIPTFRELWQDAALFVAPKDSDGFAAAIRHLRDAPEARNRLARAACRRADSYSLDAMAAATTGVYGRVMHETVHAGEFA